MVLQVNTNVSAINAQRNLSLNTRALSVSLERLASGFRINRSADDAAGLQISESLRTDIRGSQRALDNAQDGINVLNIVDGAQNVIQENLQRIRELTVQAASDTQATAQRTAINQEINARRNDIDRIANTTKFNGVNLLGTSAVANFRIQYGPNSDATNDVIDLVSALGNTTTGTSGLNISTANITSNSTAQTYLGEVDSALDTLNSRRALLGAFSNRLDSAISSLSINVENLSAAESRIRNVDVAQESARLTRNQILQQAATSILAQANQSPSLALSLIRG
jgi:flagellin